MIFTQENFTTEVLQSNLPVLVDVFTTWCGPCKQMAPLIEELASEYEGRMKIGELDAEANGEISTTLKVQAVPLFLVFKYGLEVERFTGKRSKKELLDVIARYVTEPEEEVTNDTDGVKESEEVVGQDRSDKEQNISAS